MKWDIVPDRPVYVQLVEQLEQALASGVYNAGEHLPSVRELAASAAVNPNTMQRALQELETRGLVAAQRTAGRTITQDAQRIAQLRARLARTQAAAFLAAMKSLGYTRQETLALLEAQAQEDV